MKGSERDLVAALEFKDFACLVSRRDVKPQSFDDLSNLRHLIGIRCRELTGADPEAVFQADPHVTADRGRDRRDRHLRSAGAENRPAIIIAEQAIGRALHVQCVLGMWTDASADAQDGLDKERWLHQAAIEEMRGRVEMADVVALELEPRAVAAAPAQDLGDVGIQGSVELRSPRLLSLFGLHPREAYAYTFYDGAFVKIIDPLPSQIISEDLQFPRVSSR